MLTTGSSSDASSSEAASEASADAPDMLLDLTRLMAELPDKEMNAALAQRGLGITDDHEVNALTLAHNLMMD